MDRKLAKVVLEDFMEELRQLSYQVVHSRYYENPSCITIQKEEMTFQVEVEAHDLPAKGDKGTFLVMVGVDDGGFLSSLFPVTGSIVIAQK